MFNLTGWQDHLPDPIIESVSGVDVLRDDLIEFGSKARFADFLVGTSKAKEFVFGSSPRWGYAQISLAYLCQRYKKKFTLFLAKGELHPYTRKAIALGANVIQVPMGFLNVTEKRAKDYAAQKPSDRFLFPIGLEHPSVMASISQVARDLSLPPPDDVWVASSSGTLQRGLSLAWPRSKVYALEVGHKMTDTQRGRAIVLPCKYQFSQIPSGKKPDELPPFPAALHYEAKLWKAMNNFYRTHKRPKKILFWNVGGEPKSD